MFSGFELPADIASTGDLAAAYEHGVPMGGRLNANDAQSKAVSLFAWAVQDPDNAPLAKLQVVKGWIEAGTRQELVYDVACGGSTLNATTGKCEDNNAQVNLNDCRWGNTAAPQNSKHGGLIPISARRKMRSITCAWCRTPLAAGRLMTAYDSGVNRPLTPRPQ
jgi:hypothetical protein